MGKAKAKAQTETILKLSDLAEWERNPRTITDEAMAGLGKSIESFGDVSGITWNRRLGALVAGHQRVKQLREKANGQEVPIQMLAPDLGVMVVGGKAFSVRIVDWDEATHAAAAIATNSRHIAGEWVEADLSVLLGEVQELSPDMFEELRFDVLADSNGVVLGDVELSDTPFDAFAPPDVPDDCVGFRFGDYGGRVQKVVYESFVKEYKGQQSDSGEPMLTDVLRAWLNV